MTTSRVRVLGGAGNLVRESYEGFVLVRHVMLGPRSIVTLYGGIIPKPMWEGEFKIEFAAIELLIPPTWLEGGIVLEEIRTEDNYDASKSGQIISKPNIKIDAWDRTPEEIEAFVKMWHGHLNGEDDNQLRIRAAQTEKHAALPVEFVMGAHTIVHCRFKNPMDEERVVGATFRGRITIDKPDGYTIDPRHDRLAVKLLEKLEGDPNDG